MTAYPFVICRFVHDPLIHASETSMLEQGFFGWIRCGMGIPLGYQLVGISIHSPAAVAYDSGSPVTFLCMVDTHPVMLASSRFRRRLGCFCGRLRCFRGGLRFRRLGTGRCCFWRFRFRWFSFYRLGGGWICGFGRRLGRLRFRWISRL